MSKQPRISVFPKGYMEELSDGRMTIFEWIKQAGTLGADGLELYPSFLKDTSEEYLLSIKRAAEKENLIIPMMCSSPDFTHPDALFRENEINKMKNMIDVMHFLGPGDFQSCRVLSGQRRPEVSIAEGIQWTVDSINELLLYAESKNVHLVMENHYKDGFWIYPEFAQKSEVFLPIIKQISSPYFGVNYDPSNAIFAGEDPIVLLEEVKNRVVTAHASDRYLAEGYSLDDIQKYVNEGYSDALSHGVIGKGLNDYHQIFTILKSIHFDGWISIEDGVNGLHELKESVVFLREMIDKYYAIPN
ncbi:sugar phosphate isomerase/epimerase family protein [Lederbergia wuyishanensis]|uniref:Sugar phosphate isomerase/epimerase n=1 Tax=Lederbergia wuyishanensis TaxID=1347903 RepID=A0ABU0D2C6_9BACI|nr:sugar phosphate isomerase/epimerase family protein [Lederbergia wuyishanensis]MCJ8007292.1 sugar phosphate isomerase/epimerase [Lederbergia wuyishanensis]MDQ0342551.1 sugar phosphate isomerase/epimerase [Lederbergia wuyishanensis]